jgi:hypothetical protein
MEHEFYTIGKLFIACDGKWEMPPFTTPALAARAKAAFDTINSGVELLKAALVEAEQMAPEDFHNFIELHIAALGKKLSSFSGEQIELPLTDTSTSKVRVWQSL